MEQISLFDGLTNKSWQEVTQGIIDDYVKEAGFPDGCIFVRANYSRKFEGVITSYSIVVGKPDYPRGVNKSGMICSPLYNIEDESEKKTKTGVIVIKTTSASVSNAVAQKFSQVEIKTRDSDNYFRIPISATDPLYSTITKCMLENTLDRYFRSGTDAFGCCHLYRECSDAKKCLHENLLYARGCSYYYNLVNGRIFYGANRTVGQ